jgi:hypothetical protein
MKPQMVVIHGILRNARPGVPASTVILPPIDTTISHLVVMASNDENLNNTAQTEDGMTERLQKEPPLGRSAQEHGTCTAAIVAIVDG